MGWVEMGSKPKPVSTLALEPQGRMKSYLSRGRSILEGEKLSKDKDPLSPLLQTPASSHSSYQTSPTPPAGSRGHHMPTGSDSVPPPFPLIDTAWNPTIKALLGYHGGEGRKRSQGSGGPGLGISHLGHYSRLERGVA